jgi:hypothetical protein
MSVLNPLWWRFILVPEPPTTALTALGITVLIRPLARGFHFNFCKPRKTKA